MIAAGQGPGAATLVIGCGNPLRGDDAVGIEVVRRLGRRDLPPHVRCLDAGTAGLDVVLAMRQADDVILIDAAAPSDTACSSPGRLSERALDDLPGIAEGRTPAAGLSIHTVRWDQAIMLARALGGPQPARVTCFLIEGGSFGYGEPLSPAVEEAADQLVNLLAQRLTQQPLTDEHPRTA